MKKLRADDIQVKKQMMINSGNKLKREEVSVYIEEDLQQSKRSRIAVALPGFPCNRGFRFASTIRTFSRYTTKP